MIRAIRPTATADTPVTWLVGWNVAPNDEYQVDVTPAAATVGVILSRGGVIVATGGCLPGTDQPVMLAPAPGQTLGRIDADLPWHLLISSPAGPASVTLAAMVDLPDEIHPVYQSDALALSRATGLIDNGTHITADITVTCPLGMGAGLGAVVAVPVDGEDVAGQVESITWTATPDGAIEQAVIRQHIPIAPAAPTPPPAPPVVADDTGATDAATTTSGNVLTNDDPGLTVVAVNGLSARVGQVATGSNGGVFSVAADGAWTFDPAGDFAGLTGSDTATTSVTYHASDGTAEAMGTLTVTVSASSASPWHPSSLFGVSDVGGCWDLTDISTLYQDVAMTAPVTAAGQNVNLATDISGKGQDVGGTAPMTFRSSGGLNWCENSKGLLPRNFASNFVYPFTLMIAGDTTGFSGNTTGVTISDAAAGNRSVFAIGDDGTSGPSVAVYNTSYYGASCGQSRGKFVTVSTFKSGSQAAVDHNGNASSPALNVACPANLNDFTVGGLRRTPGTVAYSGKYACALLISRELTAEEKTNLINWAKAKAGIV